jgi:hypothetical protein
MMVWREDLGIFNVRVLILVSNSTRWNYTVNNFSHLLIIFIPTPIIPKEQLSIRAYKSLPYTSF